MLWLSVGPGPVDMVPPTLSFSLGGVTGSPTASLCVLLSSSETSWRGVGGGSSLESLSQGSEHSISQPALCVETENKSAPPPDICFFQLTEVKKQLKGFTHVCPKQAVNEVQRMISTALNSYLHNKWFLYGSFGDSSGRHSIPYWYAPIISGDGRSQAHYRLAKLCGYGELRGGLQLDL